LKELVSSVSPKGQVTIPVEIRRLMGVKAKDKVAFTVSGSEVKIAAASGGLSSSFMAVPALKKQRSLREVTDIAHEEHAADTAGEGL